MTLRRVVTGVKELCHIFIIDKFAGTMIHTHAIPLPGRIATPLDLVPLHLPSQELSPSQSSSLIGQNLIQGAGKPRIGDFRGRNPILIKTRVWIAVLGY